MRILLLCFVFAVAAHAQGDEVPLPSSFKLTYELVSHDPGVGANKLEVTWAKDRARLTLSLTEKGQPRVVTVDPWLDAKTLWKHVETAKLFDFKPQEGDPTPHFSEVKLALEVETADGKRAAAHHWKAPLRNDGQVWALLDYLDRLMTAPPPAASPSPSPSAR